METFFLACFAFGVLFTVASVILGAVGAAGHAGGHVGLAGHVGHAGHLGDPSPGHLGEAGHAHVDTGHGGDVGHGDGHPHLSDRLGGLPLLNVSAILGALTWFGAAGYLLVRLGDWALPAVLLGALLAGAVGWYLVVRFLGLILAGEREMDPSDYRLEGTIGRVTVSIPAGGTGEVVFSKAGARRSEAARGLGGAAIPRGSEVVITTYADGFATVQPWGEFIAARERAPAIETERHSA